MYHKHRNRLHFQKQPQHIFNLHTPASTIWPWHSSNWEMVPVSTPLECEQVCDSLVINRGDGSHKSGTIWFLRPCPPWSLKHLHLNPELQVSYHAVRKSSHLSMPSLGTSVSHVGLWILPTEGLHVSKQAIRWLLPTINLHPT